MAGAKRRPEGGGDSSNKRSKVGGMELSFELDSEIAKYFDQVNLPIGTYPKYIPQRPLPPTARERSSINHYRDIRDRVRDGPHYAILGERPPGTKGFGSGSSNPFEDMPTYAHSFKRVKRKIPKLDARNYELRFFPEQLWTILDPEKRELTEEEQAAKKRKLAKDRLERIGDEEDEDGGEGKRKRAGADDDDDDAESDEDAEQEQEEQDDAFDDDEDDMEDDNDYNALMYWKEDDEGEGDEDNGGYDD